MPPPNPPPRSATPAPLLLLGAGGLVRETLAAIAAVNEIEPTWQVLGVLDDDEALHGSTVGGHPVLGPAEVVESFPNASVVVSFASPRDRLARKRQVRRMDLPDERYATIVHPAAVIGAGTVLGPGCIALAGVVTTTDVSVGAHCVLMPNATLTHDDHLASYVICGAGATLAGGVRVGEGSYLGAGCSIREGCAIGALATLGIGAVVISDVPVGQIWVGVPAHYLRSIELPVMEWS